MLPNCVRGMTNIKIYERTSSADIPCSEHNSFILLWINSFVFSYSLHTSSITVRYIFILFFAFITDCTDPVDRSLTFKYLLAQRICKKPERRNYKVKNHEILYRLCDCLSKQNYYPFWAFRCSFLDDILND